MHYAMHLRFDASLSSAGAINPVRLFRGLRPQVVPIAAGVALWLAASAGTEILADVSFLRGDANADGVTDISDAVHGLLCLYAGGRCSDCADAADINDDGVHDIADPIYLLSHLFRGESPPPAPVLTCGIDPTADDLACTAFPPCAREDTIPTARGFLEIFPIEHATLALRGDGRTIAVDPVGGAARFASLPPPDIILITHAHGDHLSASTLQGLVTAHTILIVPQVVANALAGSGLLDIAETRILQNGDTTEYGGIQVEAMPMYNLTPDNPRHAPGVGNGYVLTLASTRVYIAGDTEDTPEMLALEDIALAFLPMNLPYTMSPAQAASAALVFQPRVVYPYHYSGQDPAEFKSLVEAESTTIEVRLRNWYP